MNFSEQTPNPFPRAQFIVDTPSNVKCNKPKFVCLWYLILYIKHILAQLITIVDKKI